MSVPTPLPAGHSAAGNFGIIQPGNFDEAMTIAEIIAGSTMVPDEYKGKPGNCLVAIQMGMEVGLGPMQALQTICVINGKPSIYGDGLLALVKGSGLCESLDEWFDEKTQTAVCKVKRRGCKARTENFSMAMAKKSGLLGRKGPWQTFPERMCKMRARSWALRDEFADVLKGMSGAPLADEKEVTGEVIDNDEPEPAEPQRDWKTEYQALSDCIRSLCEKKDLDELKQPIMEFPSQFQDVLIQEWNKRYHELEKADEKPQAASG